MERQRQSIPIQGINRAESDDTVKDGSCEDIYNLRYRAGVFENVRQPLILHPIEQAGGFSIVHRLDVMEPGEYLAEKGSGLFRVKISGGTVTEQEKITDLPVDASDIRYFHFGNVLYVNYKQGGELQELCFRYKDNAFARVDFGMLEPPTMRLRTIYKSASKDQIPMTDGLGSGGGTGSTGVGKIEAVKLAYAERYSGQPASNKDEYFYNVGLKEVTDEGYIPGTAYLCAAYKLFDGSIIKPGKIQVLSGESGEASGTTLYKYISEFSGSISTSTTQKCTYYGRVAGVKPTAYIDVPDEVRENDLIKSVVILSTRNMTTYDFENLHTKFGRDGFPTEKIAGEDREMIGVWSCSHGCVQNDELTESLGVMYEIADIKFRDGETSLELTYSEHYKNVEYLPVFSPNYSCHNTLSGGKYEYNDRLHIYDLKTVLFGGFDPMLKSNEAPNPHWTYVENSNLEYIVDVNMTIGDVSFRIRRKIAGAHWEYNTGQYIVLNNVLSYPDSRAISIDVWVKSGIYLMLRKNILLKSSPGNNYASGLLEPRGEGVAPYAIYDLRHQGSSLSIPEPSKMLTVCEVNKIQVSYPSNPFVYAPANIYTVGGQGEQIREVISTAERMTEAAYGYQPLLVFTNRTTYALESGEGEVLYARNIPILSQSMIEGTNAVEGNGAVFFVSTSGVTVIVRGQISTISEPMKRWAGLIASDATIPDFEEYTRSASLMFNRKESELIVYNAAYSYAYVYSLLGKYWTRRTWDAAIEPCFGEIVTASGVASLFEEDPARPVASCKLVTRPLKFGSLEYKRLETLAARMRWGQGSRFSLFIDGSDDAMQWVPLRNESNQPSIRRTPSSFRYHRVQLTGSVADYLAITHFDVEFYNRFVHKLR